MKAELTKLLTSPSHTKEVKKVYHKDGLIVFSCVFKLNQETLIKDVLEATGLSQKDIADKLEVSTAQVSKWKHGDPIPEQRQAQLIELLN